LLTKPSSSPHVFVPLNNATYLSCALGTPLARFHELDWWDERNLRVSIPPSSASTNANSDGTAAAVNTEVRLTCTPSQHMSGRALSDRFHALWASWVVEGDILGSHKKVYFAGDTGYQTVHDGEDEDKAPVCPAFAEIGERFGGFDVALLPIGCVSQLKEAFLYAFTT
jgi:N-acyl-phosphatidylethanolamine-hydrolysing phospholipase D